MRVRTPLQRSSRFGAPGSLLIYPLFALGCLSRALPTVDPSAGTGGTLGNDGSVDNLARDAARSEAANGGARSDGGSGEAQGATGGAGGRRAATGNKLDLLFMIDDSSSMAPLQAKMRVQIPTFLDALVDPTTGKLPDLHVAVISSSYGAGAWGNVNQCHQRSFDPATLGDDGGRFLQGAVGAAISPCTMLHAGQKYLVTGDGASGAPNFDGDIRDALSCITNIGDKGCGFESQFESTYYALYKASRPDDPDNGGFLRDDARLAIVMLTNEDDCSVRSDSLLFDPAVNSVSDPSGLGALASYRCNEFGHLCNGQPPPHEGASLPSAGVTLSNCVSAEEMGKTDSLITDPNGNPDTTMGHLWPTVREFSDYLRMYKADPNDVFLAAIAGPTTDSAGNSLYRVSPRANAAAQNELDPTIDHSCTQMTADPASPEYADPAVRIKQLVDGFGANGVFYPICANDFSSTMSGIASAIRLRQTVP